MVSLVPLLDDERWLAFPAVDRARLHDAANALAVLCELRSPTQDNCRYCAENVDQLYRLAGKLLAALAAMGQRAEE